MLGNTRFRCLADPQAAFSAAGSSGSRDGEAEC